MPLAAKELLKGWELFQGRPRSKTQPEPHGPAPWSALRVPETEESCKLCFHWFKLEHTGVNRHRRTVWLSITTSVKFFKNHWCFLWWDGRISSRRKIRLVSHAVVKTGWLSLAVPFIPLLRMGPQEMLSAVGAWGIPSVRDAVKTWS